ncbi:DUF1654 domain-containing protein [Pseudomonas graminis]|uniref:DUF1654 domain-containing protein n=1 Tax=Pseudomonas graminis TaxID=158627 RepID=A0A1I0HYC9_9PSED|nr:Protein of unknown function [Pseudomonas graminis]
MLSHPDFTRSKPRTYEQIGHRVREIISDPKVQKIQFAIISRLPDESPTDWRRLLSEMAGTAGIKIERVEGDGYRVAWQEYCEA